MMHNSVNERRYWGQEEVTTVIKLPEVFPTPGDSKVTVVHIWESYHPETPYHATDKYGMSDFKFRTEKERQDFIDGFKSHPTIKRDSRPDTKVEILYAPKKKIVGDARVRSRKSSGDDGSDHGDQEDPGDTGIETENDESNVSEGDE
jgi:hypothetical protein